MTLIAETTLALRLVSEANAHTHWRTRQKRAREQRFCVAMAMRSQLRGLAVRLAADGSISARVFMTRIAPRSLDSDNAVGSAKHVRDSVAECLGIDDRDPRVTWIVEQEKGAIKTYGVRIRVEVSQ